MSFLRLFSVLAVVLLTECLQAAVCAHKGCTRYPSSKGYCQEHQSDAITDWRLSRGKKATPSTTYSSYVTPEALMPATGFNPNYIITHDVRVWTNTRGKKVEAELTHISEDGKKVYLTYKSNKRYVEVLVENLSPGDRKYVQTQIKAFEAVSMRWYKGSYLLERDIRCLELAEKAKELIRAKDQSLSKITCVEVFQAARSQGLCLAGRKDESGRFVSTYGQVFMYKAPSNDTAPIADGDLISSPRFYWAGTYEYTTVENVRKTVNIIVSDVVFAINEVMRSLGWNPSAEPKAEPNQNDVRQNADELLCTGSGFFITKTGYIVTNNHVVENGRKFRVMTSTGTVDATLVKVDAETDLAVLRINGECKPCTFSSQRKERLGGEIFTMGFPQPGLQGFSPKVTKGVISGLDGYKGDVREYQIDASIQPGNSGGPLFDMSGHIVGVVVASLRGGQVVNYAIKKPYLMAFLDSVGCSDDVSEATSDGSKDLTSVVDAVRDSCVLVMTYK